ncbi:IS3 family transposase [Evansella halocellulosilytica]|uniref:IS3 family transposase n=1 Tax=Evansella halocellulosilytica TaxID=2011013 RepID=UPI00211C6DEB|nr:IS3 family transposase [Evansella halocellulosilytica]
MENHRAEFSVTKMCKVLGVSRSGFHKWRNHTPSPQEQREKAVKERILYHYHDSEKRYGAPKITELLLQEGYKISDRTVGIYMNDLGVHSCVVKKFRVRTTDSNHNHPIAPNTLDQQFTVSAPNKVWVSDITYIPCREGRQYLATILDLCTREIVGWRLDNHMSNELVLDALKDAYHARKPEKGLLHHSDRGTQYASHAYRQQLEDFGMEASMSRTGNCYDNACAESFFSLLKKRINARSTI